MKKRLFLLMLAVFFALACVPIAVVADGTDIEADINDMYITRFKVETVNVDNDDETAQVSVKLISNSGFAGVAYCLEYDMTALTLEQQPEIGDFDGFVLGPIDGVGWHMGMLSSTENIYDEDGVLLTYTFKINPDATSGFYEIKFVTSGSVEIDENRTQELVVLDENLAVVENDSISGGIVIPGYTVYYDANGGSGAPQSHNKPKNGSVNISSTIPVRDGYSFLGWATSSTATEVQYESGAEYSENANLTLYAVWEEQEIPAGTVKMEVTVVTGKAGDEVKVDVNITENPSIHAMVFDVVYDDNLLEYVSVEKGIYGNVCIPHVSKLNYQYMDVYSYDNTMTETGTLLTFTFKIKDDVSEGFAPVTVIPDYDQFLKLVDVGEHLETGYLDVEVVSGGVRINNGLIGDLNSDGEVNQKDRTILARHLAGWEGYEANTFDYALADINQDGEVNQKDRTALARHLAGWEGYETLPYLG